jgi:hypothetical protein
VLILEINPSALRALGSSVPSLLELLRRHGYAHFADFHTPTIPFNVPAHQTLPRNVIASKSPLACWRTAPLKLTRGDGR